jgi:hypothetical protein
MNRRRVINGTPRLFEAAKNNPDVPLIMGPPKWPATEPATRPPRQLPVVTELHRRQVPRGSRPASCAARQQQAAPAYPPRLSAGAPSEPCGAGSCSGRRSRPPGRPAPPPPIHPRHDRHAAGSAEGPPHPLAATTDPSRRERACYRAAHPAGSGGPRPASCAARQQQAGAARQQQAGAARQQQAAPATGRPRRSRPGGAKLTG